MSAELIAPVDIATADGRLRREAIGWSRHPVQRCNLAPGLARVARWNYWCFTTREGALTVLVADVGLAGVTLISFLDFAARGPVERVHVRPRGLAVPLPDGPGDDVTVDTRRLHLAMRHRAGVMHVEVDARTVLGRRITAELAVDRPPTHETVNVLVPWDDTHFQFTSKQQALAVRGHVDVDRRRYHYGPDNQGFACLDFGRGRWPSRIEWNWAFASGHRAGRTIGLNLGGRWTDGTGVTENGIVIDGRLHKLADAVDFTYDRRDFMAPWRIRTRTTSRLDLRFTPMRERAVKVPLVLAHVELHQMMGHFDGTFVDDGGAPVAIADMLGLAEWVLARYPG